MLPNVVKQPGLQEVGDLPLCLIGSYFKTGSLKQIAIFNASRAYLFTGSTTKTAVDVILKSLRVHRQPSFIDCSHEINATARAVVFIAGRDVRGTGLETQAAMNAGENLFFLTGNDAR
jgi:hypothetical protein